MTTELLARAARSRMSPELRRDAIAFLDLAAHARAYGPPAVPMWLGPIFDYCGRKSGLSGPLLAAIAGVMTRFDPGYTSTDGETIRAGLLALPIAPDELPDHVVTLPQLLEGGGVDRTAALARLRGSVCAAAELLLDLRRYHASLAIALLHYLGKSERLTGEVAAAFTFYTVRNVDPAVFEQFRELL